MKRKFPGIRKTFNFGYKQLMERDFFQLKDRDLNSMLLIDRINLYFKAGYNCGVKFNKTEKEFVERVDRAETMDEVIQLAKELFAYTKAERELHKDELEELQKLSEQERGEESEEWDIDGEPTDEESDDGDYQRDHSFETPIQDHNIQNDTDIDLMSETDTKLQQKLEELADDSIQYKYYKLVTDHAIDPVIPFKRVVKETACVDEVLNAPEYEHTRAAFTKFMVESEKMVNYLVKEFEMRKSAHAYKRAKIAKSGSLNMSKLYAHKLSDDIFKRITTIPNGKNHGMIFLLDWSGSMHDVIIPTVKQVINLCMFCRRVNIPFEVYAFSGCYNNRNRNDDEFNKLVIWNTSMKDRKGENLLFTDGHYALLQLFSNKMTNAEFMANARRFSTHLISYANGYNLGDTPLNDALVYMTKYIPQFKKQYGIEKLTFITLTDGQSCSLNQTDYLRERDWDGIKKITYKNFLRDAKNGKDYEIAADAYKQTEAMLRMIRDQNDCKVLGFYICKNKIRYLRDVFTDHYGYQRYSHELEVAKMRKQFKEQGFYSLQNTGRDDLFVIPDSATEIIDDNAMESIDGDLSASMIAKKFSKMFNTKKHSRVLLDKFIGYVA